MVVWTVSGALEVHLLALEDKLKGREADLTEEIINATCTDGDFNEVSENPSSSLSAQPGHAIVSRLLFQVLGVGAAAAEQRRRSQPARDMEQWSFINSSLLGGLLGIVGDRQGAGQARCKTRHRWGELL